MKLLKKKRTAEYRSRLCESVSPFLGKGSIRGDNNMEMLRQILLFFDGLQAGLLLIVPLIIYWMVRRVRRKNKEKTGYLEE